MSYAIAAIEKNPLHVWLDVDRYEDVIEYDTEKEAVEARPQSSDYTEYFAIDLRKAPLAYFDDLDQSRCWERISEHDSSTLPCLSSHDHPCGICPDCCKLVNTVRADIIRSAAVSG